MNTVSFNKPINRNESIFDGIVAYYGKCAALIFMIFQLAEGYAALKILPKVPFLSSEFCGLLMASSLTSLNFVIVGKLRGKWSSAKTFALVMIITILGAEQIVSLAGIVKLNSGDAYIKGMERAIDLLIDDAQRVDQMMADDYSNRLTMLKSKAADAEAGRDVSRENQCGPICKTSLVHRDSLANAYLPLLDVRTQNSKITNANLASKFAVLEAIFDGVAAKNVMFEAFSATVRQQEVELNQQMAKYLDGISVPTATTFPASSAFRMLSSKLAGLRAALFEGNRNITEEQIQLRLTAATLERCLSLGGNSSDYLAFVLSLALIALLPCWSIARHLTDDADSDLPSLIEKVEKDTSLFERLHSALWHRGKAKFEAGVAGDAWERSV